MNGLPRNDQFLCSTEVVNSGVKRGVVLFRQSDETSLPSFVKASTANVRKVRRSLELRHKPAADELALRMHGINSQGFTLRSLRKNEDTRRMQCA